MFSESFDCTWCHEAKSRESFYTYKSGKRFPQCKTCQNNRTRENRAKLLAEKPEVVRERDRRYNQNRPEGYQAEANLKSRYGLTVADRDAMVANQGGKCAICKRKESESRGGRLCVDHCHDTGAIRAMICNECNVGLGRFSDNPLLLRAAANYIEYWSDFEQAREVSE